MDYIPFKEKEYLYIENISKRNKNKMSLSCFKKKEKKENVIVLYLEYERLIKGVVSSNSMIGFMKFLDKNVMQIKLQVSRQFEFS